MNSIVLASCIDPPVEPQDDELLAAALRRAGCCVSILPWTEIDSSRAGSGTAIILHSTWDYHRHAERFLCWLSDLEARNVPILNPPTLVRLTIDKGWLTASRPFGCAAPVTLRVASDAAAIDREIQGRHWDRFILKPPVSASADGLFLLDAGDTGALHAALEDQPAHVLVQEFLPEIREGEFSLIVFDGRFSHAVRKVPAPDDFRVQEEFGSRTDLLDPPSPALAAARRVLENLPETPCYARIDGVMREREFLLMEVELIEPDLFLRLKPGAEHALAEAIIRRIRARRA